MNKREQRERIEGRIECPLCQSNKEQCPRCQAYERLPKWRLLQAFITFVMGVPHPDPRQTPIFKHRKFTRVITLFIVFYSSVALTCSLVAMFAAGNLFAQVLLVPPIIASLMITSGTLRTMSTYVLHYAGHGVFGKYNRFRRRTRFDDGVDVVV